MTSDERRQRRRHCAAALQQQQLHTPIPRTSWTRRDLEKIARAPQVVDGGGGGGGGDFVQRIRRSMRGTALYIIILK